jgi:hypothetical protein
VSDSRTCAACQKAFDKSEGLELWNTWYCSLCFISNSAKLHKEFTAADIEQLRRLGKDLAGLLPGELLEMTIVGFHKRCTGQERPDETELARLIGEIQRLAAFSVFRQVLNLLRTWQNMFTEFTEQQEGEIRDKIKRLTDLE